MTKDPDNDTALGKALAILNLFSLQAPAWSAEAIAAEIGASPATAYRYLRDLTDAGLVERQPGGLYGLGSNILALDYRIRRTDPLLNAARGPMQALAEASGLDCVLTGLAGVGLIDMHRAFGARPLTLDYGRGRVRPAFAGAAAKMIAASFPRARLRSYYDAHVRAAAGPDANLGADFAEVALALRRIRRAGFYLSRGELELGVGAIAVAGPQTAGAGRYWALALVARLEDLDARSPEALIEQLAASAREIATG